MIWHYFYSYRASSKIHCPFIPPLTIHQKQQQMVGCWWLPDCLHWKWVPQIHYSLLKPWTISSLLHVSVTSLVIYILHELKKVTFLMEKKKTRQKPKNETFCFQTLCSIIHPSPSSSPWRFKAETESETQWVWGMGCSSAMGRWPWVRWGYLLQPLICLKLEA